ncbi:hypothetical protein [Wolbachia endosymbiont of Folsomia candida]|uniref:hypothetical protein n=1 Tax=Wolbachia endosymbiont of Folsomia candida TaxID=169402 RepID=UPI000B0F30AC|nr:hypothetical protein [Wolbachia endosymbiont of Folsomia candida]
MTTSFAFDGNNHIYFIYIKNVVEVKKYRWVEGSINTTNWGQSTVINLLQISY